MFVFRKVLACFVFLKRPFWDSPFCLITDDFPMIRKNFFIAAFIPFFCSDGTILELSADTKLCRGLVFYRKINIKLCYFLCCGQILFLCNFCRCYFIVWFFSGKLPGFHSIEVCFWSGYIILVWFWSGNKVMLNKHPRVVCKFSLQNIKAE